MSTRTDTELTLTPHTTTTTDQTVSVIETDARPTGPLAGNPGLVGIPLTIAGAIGLGFSNMGYLSPTGVGAVLPTILTATAVGLLITTIWAAALGQNSSAGLFGVFFGFYASYAALAIGLINGWYGFTAKDVLAAQVVWFVSWIVTLVLLTVTTLNFPWTYTLLLVLVDVALLLLLFGATNSSTTLTRAGGVLIIAFIALAAYLYIDAMDRESGHRGLPVGKSLRP